jgi:hypothetical protein
MPRRRRAPKARIGGITPEKKRWFLNGFTALDGPERYGMTDAEARTIWEAHGEEWLAEYALQHEGKPPAWHRYDAPAAVS